MTVGKFIVVEGLDNVGKTTFVQYFLKQNPLVIPRKFPSRHTADVINAMNYRNIDWKKIHSIFHNDLQNGMAQIQMTLAGGASVICDRYVYSHWVYEMLRDNESECGFFPFVEPDAIVYLRPKDLSKIPNQDKDNLENGIDYVKGQRLFDQVLTPPKHTVVIPALEWNTNDEAAKALDLLLGGVV